MVDRRTTDQDKLMAYLGTNPKYFATPVPAPLAKSVVVEFLSAQLKSPQSSESLRKLVRLAVFYDAREVAPGFEALLREHDREPVDTARAALAVTALAWIGDDQQKQKSQSYFESLLKGFPDQRHRNSMLEACAALGPREGTQPLRAWIQRGIAQLRSNLERHRQQKQADEAESSEDQIDELEEFIAVDIAAQDRANEIRKPIEGAPSADGVIPRIELLYIGDTPDATPRLSEWAAMELIRVADPTRNYRARIAAEFASISQRYQSVQGKQRTQAALFGARSLRAAAFFGHQLNGSDSSWLAKQPDSGSDPLALRPNWQYAAAVQAEK